MAAEEQKPKGTDAAAKQTKMAQEAAEAESRRLAERTYMADESAWENADGEEYGGQADILEIKEGEIAGPFVYVGHQEMTTDLGDTTVHMATNKDGDTLRLPIQATFLRAIDQADVIRGDTFLIKRFEDQIKKKGKGANKPMAIFGVKVTKRVPRTVPATQ